MYLLFIYTEWGTEGDRGARLSGSSVSDRCGHCSYYENA